MVKIIALLLSSLFLHACLNEGIAGASGIGNPKMIVDVTAKQDSSTDEDSLGSVYRYSSMLALHVKSIKMTPDSIRLNNNTQAWDSLKSIEFLNDSVQNELIFELADSAKSISFIFDSTTHFGATNSLSISGDLEFMGMLFPIHFNLPIQGHHTSVIPLSLSTNRQLRMEWNLKSALLELLRPGCTRKYQSSDTKDVMCTISDHFNNRFIETPALFQSQKP